MLEQNKNFWNESESSRRDFLKQALATGAYFMLSNSGAGKLTLAENNLENFTLIRTVGDGTDFRIVDTFNHPLLELINFHWDNYFDHKTPTTGIVQGILTLFGVSSISDLQLITRTDDIRFKIERGEELTERELFLLAIRNLYDVITPQKIIL